jgi:hypothetical protein
VRPATELGLPGYVRVTTGASELMEAVGKQIAEAVEEERSRVRAPL